MLEQDYLKSSQPSAFSYQQDYSFKDERSKALNEYSTQLIKELIIPKLTKEVNSSKRYAPLRQVYYSLILSRWFKQKFRRSSLRGTASEAKQDEACLSGRQAISTGYIGLIDTKNLTNLTSKDPWSKTTYFKEYQKSFTAGEYNIQEPVYTPTGQVIRSYFSGGIKIAGSPLIGDSFIGVGDNLSKFPGILMAGNAGNPNISLQPAFAASPMTQAGAASPAAQDYLEEMLRDPNSTGELSLNKEVFDRYSVPTAWFMDRLQRSTAGVRGTTLDITDALWKEKFSQLTAEERVRLVRESYEKILSGEVESGQMHPFVVALFTQAYANYIKNNFPPEQWGMFIGYDERFFSKEFADLQTRILAGNGLKVYRDSDGSTPTPVSSYLGYHLNVAGSIEDTASHNPPYQTGMKSSTFYGGVDTDDISDKIAIEVAKLFDIRNLFGSIKYGSLADNPLIITIDAKEIYFDNYVKKLFTEHDLDILKRAMDQGAQFIFDGIWGVGGKTIKYYLGRLLKDYQWQDKVILINDQPDPTMHGIVKPDPSIVDTLEYTGALAVLAKFTKVLTSVTADMDADRIGIGVIIPEAYIAKAKRFGLVVKQIGGVNIVCFTPNQIFTLIAYERVLEFFEKELGTRDIETVKAKVKAGEFDPKRLHLLTTIPTSKIAQTMIESVGGIAHLLAVGFKNLGREAYELEREIIEAVIVILMEESGGGQIGLLGERDERNSGIHKDKDTAILALALYITAARLFLDGNKNLVDLYIDMAQNLGGLFYYERVDVELSDNQAGSERKTFIVNQAEALENPGNRNTLFTLFDKKLCTDQKEVVIPNTKLMVKDNAGRWEIIEPKGIRYEFADGEAIQVFHAGEGPMITLYDANERLKGWVLIRPSGTENTVRVYLEVFEDFQFPHPENLYRYFEKLMIYLGLNQPPKEGVPDYITNLKTLVDKKYVSASPMENPGAASLAIRPDREHNIMIEMFSAEGRRWGKVVVPPEVKRGQETIELWVENKNKPKGPFLLGRVEFLGGEAYFVSARLGRRLLTNTPLLQHPDAITYNADTNMLTVEIADPKYLFLESTYMAKVKAEPPTSASPMAKSGAASLASENEKLRDDFLQRQGLKIITLIDDKGESTRITRSITFGIENKHDEPHNTDDGLVVSSQGDTDYMGLSLCRDSSGTHLLVLTDETDAMAIDHQTPIVIGSPEILQSAIDFIMRDAASNYWTVGKLNEDLQKRGLPALVPISAASPAAKAMQGNIMVTKTITKKGRDLLQGTALVPNTVIQGQEEITIKIMHNRLGVNTEQDVCVVFFRDQKPFFREKSSDGTQVQEPIDPKGSVTWADTDKIFYDENTGTLTIEGANAGSMVGYKYAAYLAPAPQAPKAAASPLEDANLYAQESPFANRSLLKWDTSEPNKLTALRTPSQVRSFVIPAPAFFGTFTLKNYRILRLATSDLVRAAGIVLEEESQSQGVRDILESLESKFNALKQTAFGLDAENSKGALELIKSFSYWREAGLPIITNTRPNITRIRDNFNFSFIPSAIYQLGWLLIGENSSDREKAREAIKRFGINNLHPQHLLALRQMVAYYLIRIAEEKKEKINIDFKEKKEILLSLGLELKATASRPSPKDEGVPSGDNEGNNREGPENAGAASPRPSPKGEEVPSASEGAAQAPKAAGSPIRQDNAFRLANAVEEARRSFLQKQGLTVISGTNQWIERSLTFGNDITRGQFGAADAITPHDAQVDYRGLTVCLDNDKKFHLVLTDENEPGKITIIFQELLGERIKDKEVGEAIGFVEERAKDNYPDLAHLIDDLREQGIQTGSSALKETPGGIDGSTSSPSIPDNSVGGIDFRTLQPMGIFKGLDFRLPQLSSRELEAFNLDREIEQLKNMASSGIIPADDRLVRILAARAQKGQVGRQNESLVPCFADICKLQEENACDSSPTFLVALVFADGQG